MTQRRFPPPWTVEDTGGGIIEGRLSPGTSRLIKAFCLRVRGWRRHEKASFYTLVRQLREVEQQFTQFEWQLTRLEPEEFARRWEDNTHKLEEGNKEAKERDAAFRRAAKWCLEFHTYRVELERRRRLQ